MLEFLWSIVNILFLFVICVVNIEGLKEYLTLHNLPMMVSLSEDATAAVGKRQYNSTTNSIYGLSPPLQPNDLPNWKDSVINSALDAVLMFSTYKMATVLIVVVAQPMGDGIPPIRICLFGSDNTFKTTDVKHRLKTIVSLLKTEGIIVLTYSADGDSRVKIN